MHVVNCFFNSHAILVLAIHNACVVIFQAGEGTLLSWLRAIRKKIFGGTVAQERVFAHQRFGVDGWDESLSDVPGHLGLATFERHAFGVDRSQLRVQIEQGLQPILHQYIYKLTPFNQKNNLLRTSFNSTYNKLKRMITHTDF
jgi:hypothetical protein